MRMLEGLGTAGNECLECQFALILGLGQVCILRAGYCVFRPSFWLYVSWGEGPQAIGLNLSASLWAYESCTHPGTWIYGGQGLLYDESIGPNNICPKEKNDCGMIFWLLSFPVDINLKWHRGDCDTSSSNWGVLTAHLGSLNLAVIDLILPWRTYKLCWLLCCISVAQIDISHQHQICVVDVVRWVVWNAACPAFTGAEMFQHCQMVLFIWWAMLLPCS